MRAVLARSYAFCISGSARASFPSRRSWLAAAMSASASAGSLAPASGSAERNTATAGKIRAFESDRPENQGLHWPTIIAISFGGLMLGAGVLLFVAAHWDQLSPAQRLTSVILLVAAFHVLGAFTSDDFPHLATVFHAVGTVALGAGIFLAAQIFNLNEGWSGGVLLWALGALASAALTGSRGALAVALVAACTWSNTRIFDPAAIHLDDDRCRGKCELIGSAIAQLQVV